MNKIASKIKSLTAYEMIRDMILSGEALPGTRLVLTELEEKTGVGRGPIRDALMRLDKSGLVQNIPYKGAVVTLPPSFREMEHIYRLRIQVEIVLAIEAMRVASHSDIAQLEEIASAMENSSPDEPYFFHKDREFHRALYAISKMDHLQAIVDHLLDYVEAFLNLRHYANTDKELFIKQHSVIIQSLKDQNENRLVETLKENIMVGLELVRKEMARFPRNEK
ncbi:GntR family transcriptional regulator [uncultured Bilophila sp.]|jgi:DNA-binding GntR family transcriptional regulator|uniref:GntR family transcriptional regulator n=1 Tax=uncultured Bilophila sp. TaxID=529385 RepID=UPI0025EE8328|nr:GntR family transcriptional regulator [uncultured Bilophila sp.]